MTRNLALFSITSAILLFSCGKEAGIEEYSLDTERYKVSVSDTHFLVASDTHVLAPTLLAPNYDYDASGWGKDGRTYTYGNALFDALLKEAKTKKPDYLILTGDISHNGSKASHEYIASRLAELKTIGVEPLVIPGNHDISINNCEDYSSYPYQAIPSVDEHEYKSIYRDCGYSQSLYKNPNGLSYIVETKNNEWLLMLDSTLHKENSEHMNIAGGKFNELAWLQAKLKEAKEKNIRCISFSHHNLLTHNQSFVTDYVMENASNLLSIYKDIDLVASFSGHLHIQHIAEEDEITEIASGSLLNYGNHYGEVYLTEDGFQYEAPYLNFKTKDGSSFRDYSYSLFMDRHGYGKGEEQDYRALMNTYYFDGSLYQHPELKDSSYFDSLSSIPYYASMLASFDVNHQFLQKDWK